MATPQKKPGMKVPPHNVEAEQTVLGSILIDKNAVMKVADLLVAGDFYNPSHEKIYEVILELYEKRQPIDILSLTNRLKELDVLKSVGGSSYLAELTNQVTTAAHVEHYAQNVKEKKILRDLIRASSEITENAFAPAQDFEAMMDEMEQKILAISQKSVSKNFVPIGQELTQAYERIEKLHAHAETIRGVPTGFQQLDNLLSGLQKSDFIVLGGRPSLGKTSLALDIARNAALKGVPVGIFSLEMAREQVIDRFISAESGVPLWRLRTGRIKDEVEFQMIQRSLNKLSTAPIYIDDTSSPNILQMRSMARRLQIEHGLGLLVIDYMQLIQPRRVNSDNVVAQITEISRGLKGLARELNVPVLALSQLSRAADQQGPSDDKSPKLHHLRDSGAIEQDADVVLFISRERHVEPGQENVAQIIVAKHRNGPLGTVSVVFDQEHASFKSIDNYHTPPAGFQDAEASFSAL